MAVTFNLELYPLPTCPRLDGLCVLAVLWMGTALYSFQGTSVLILPAPCLLTHLAEMRSESLLNVPRPFWRHYSLEEDPPLTLLYFLHAPIIAWGIRYLFLFTVCHALPPPEQELHEGRDLVLVVTISTCLEQCLARRAAR